MKQTLLLSLFCLTILSCNHTNNKNSKKTELRAPVQDTTKFLDIIKSYEPKMYRGKVPKAFYTNRGFADWWRFPLVYPYSIVCVDVKEYGCICSDEGKTNFDEGGNVQPLSAYFDRFVFDRSHFIARRCKGPFDSDTVTISNQYFIFSFSIGTDKIIKGTDNLRKELKKINFSGDTTFMTIKDYERKL